jgi:hypothetical protein
MLMGSVGIMTRPCARRYTDDINILGENIHTLQKNTAALLNTSKEVSLEVNPEIC